MKTKNIIIGLTFLLVVFSYSCKDRVDEKLHYLANTPVYMSYEELRKTPITKNGQTLINPGKMYFKDNFLFINEQTKGIHVIDNSNPANPIFVAFIEICGNIDMAIKNNILYADNFVDLLLFDISNVHNIVFIKRIENVFPYITVGWEMGYPCAEVDKNKGVVIGWNLEEITEKVSDYKNLYLQEIHYADGFTFDIKFAQNTIVNNTKVGTGGSMARFIIYDDFLYMIHSSILKVYNINQLDNPAVLADVYISWDAETVFIYDQKLFIGTRQGMLIYSLQNPSEPEYLSSLSHMSSCDPVVVAGNYAYVTLRSGNQCGDTLNQLDVINIADITNPVLIKSYPMTNPHGLGIDNNTLFICDGTDGLKIFDATEPMVITNNIIAHFSGIHAFDVIPYNGVLMMIGANGLYQYDYSDLNNLVLLSSIFTNPAGK